MADYPFKINIVTKNGTKISHFDEDFASDSDIAISASVIVTRINNMGTGASYVESIENVGEGTPSYGSTGGSVYLSASYTHPNTGSIVFTDTETTTNGGLDYYVFHGAKVCSVLGLPEGIRIYSENFKLSDSSTDTTNYISGEFISDRVSLKRGFKMSPQARMLSNLIWDEVFGEGMLQWVSGSNIRMSMGYDNVTNRYEVQAPTGSFSVSNISKGTVTALTTGGIEVANNNVRINNNGTSGVIRFQGPSFSNPVTVRFNNNSILDGIEFSSANIHLNSNKIYFDAGGYHTYIQETSDDVLDFYVGSVNMLKLDEGNDTITFSGGDLKQGSDIGLAVSSSLVFQVPIDSGQNINAGGAGTEFSPEMGTPSVKNTTYITHNNGGASFDLKVPGEYQITCDLVVTDSATNDRHTFFGYIEHLQSDGATSIYKYPIGGVYIRSDVDGYDGGGLGGQARIITTTANERIRIRTRVLERQSSGTCNLDTSLSRVRVQHVTYGTEI